MQLKQIVLLVIFGGVISLAAGFMAIAGPFSFTPFIILILLVAIVVVLLVRGFKQWVESLVEKIAAGNRSDSSEVTRISESLVSMRAGIARIEERLDALEKRERE